MGQHNDFTLLMSLVLDNEATEAEAKSLREHLVGCDACSRTWQRWQELDRRFTLAPMVPAPVDFSAAIAARLDQRVAEQRHRRLFGISLALSWTAVMLIAVLAWGLTNGWHLQLLAANGSLSAGWTGVSSIAGWLVRASVALIEQMGTPTVAAAAGALLCLTCGLATVWLWMVARLSPPGNRGMVIAE